MRIAILDLTQHPLPLLSGIRRAGERIMDWISPDFFDTKFEIFDIAAGVDQVPSMRNFDALIVSGSEKSVYDDICWHDDVSNVLHESREMGKPIFGICFGHQIMASTFGGEVRRSSGDAFIGVKKTWAYPVLDALARATDTRQQRQRMLSQIQNRDSHLPPLLPAQNASCDLL